VYLQSLLTLCSALLELLDAAGLIKRTVFAGIKGMGRRRNLDELHGVFLTFKYNRLLGPDGGADEELYARSLVDKDDRAVGIRMDVLFHDPRTIAEQAAPFKAPPVL
jgi:hypothetical protein